MLNDADLLRYYQQRLNGQEDAIVEFKSQANAREWCEVCVAFANSLPVDFPGVLFIGIGPDGSPIPGADHEKNQQKLSAALERTYPPVYAIQTVVEINGVQVLAVQVPGSAERPHFTGRAFIRDGSQTREASADQFERLIFERTDKGRLLAKHVGKMVTVAQRSPEHLYGTLGEIQHTLHGALLEASSFWVVVKGDNFWRAFSINRVTPLPTAAGGLMLEISSR